MSSSPTDVYLFAGDSLTEGTYGESYVDRIAQSLSQGQGGLRGQVINAGRDAETVKSLNARLASLLQAHEPQWLVLAVGADDVWIPWLSSHSLGWWLWRQYRHALERQQPTTDLDQFAAAYRALIDQALQAGVRVLVCTPSPIGERISSPPNRLLARLSGAIKKVAAERGVPVADIWQTFVEEYAVLPKPSRRTPGEWLFVWFDRAKARSTSPDELGHRRRLLLTFDGRHLNSRGANLWASSILRMLARSQ